MKHQIKHRYTDAVLYECEVPDDVNTSGLATRHALEQAGKARTNLEGANLEGANLTRANLTHTNLVGAHLEGANLIYANLVGANLIYANLVGANLEGANLVGANLTRANLDGAKLGDKTLVGSRPVFMIGPIGSRCAYFTAYLTDAGVTLRAGCFFGTVNEFTAKLTEKHGGNEHAREYTAALQLIAAHAEIWTPKKEA